MTAPLRPRKKPCPDIYVLGVDVQKDGRYVLHPPGELRFHRSVESSLKSL